MACTVPAGMKNVSPGWASNHSSIPMMVPSSAPARACSLVTGSRNPAAIFAPEARLLRGRATFRFCPESCGGSGRICRQDAPARRGFLWQTKTSRARDIGRFRPHFTDGKRASLGAHVGEPRLEGLRVPHGRSRKLTPVCGAAFVIETRRDEALQAVQAALQLASSKWRRRCGYARWCRRLRPEPPRRIPRRAVSPKTAGESLTTPLV